MTPIVSPISRGQGNELVNKLEDAGLDGQLAQQVIVSPDNDLARRVVEFVKQGGVIPPITRVVLVNYVPTDSQKRAREIMGRNYLGIEEAIGFGASYTAEDIASLAEIPQDIMDALEAAKDDYLLVAGAPMTILDVRVKAPQGTFYSYDDAWYNSQKFASEKIAVRWYLVRKLVVPGSPGLKFAKQETLLPATDEIPSAEVETYAKVLYFQATGEKLQKGMFARTSTLDSDGYRVDVGWDDGGQFIVFDDWDAHSHSLLGLASARKSAA